MSLRIQTTGLMGFLVVLQSFGEGWSWFSRDKGLIWVWAIHIQYLAITKMCSSLGETPAVTFLTYILSIKDLLLTLLEYDT